MTSDLSDELAQMLALIEADFGPRDQSHSNFEIIFGGAGPQAWLGGDNIVTIELSLDACDDFELALYQLSHEAVHLLSPRFEANSNYLEEGLATYFSIQYMKLYFPQSYWQVRSKKYQRAEFLVARLLAVNPNLVKELRRIQPELHKVTLADFDQLVFNVDRNLIIQLLKKFPTSLVAQVIV